MKQIKIKINSEINNLLERLHYEVAARQDLLTFMIDHNMDITNSSFKAYQQEYREVYTQYNVAKKELEKQYVLPAANNEPNSWSLDFETEELTVNIMGE